MTSIGQELSGMMVYGKPQLEISMLSTLAFSIPEQQIFLLFSNDFYKLTLSVLSHLLCHTNLVSLLTPIIVGILYEL